MIKINMLGSHAVFIAIQQYRFLRTANLTRNFIEGGNAIGVLIHVPSIYRSGKCLCIVNDLHLRLLLKAIPINNFYSRISHLYPKRNVDIIIFRDYQFSPLVHGTVFQSVNFHKFLAPMKG